MILLIKAKIYQYTGIYLAYKEQCDFMESEEFVAQLMSLDGQMTIYDAIGLLVGNWQALHGFTNFYSRFSFKRVCSKTGWGYLFYLILERLDVMQKQLRKDMRLL
jgi:hypothetical protein